MDARDGDEMGEAGLVLALYQTFAKVFSKFAVWSRKAESRAKVAVWGGSDIQ